MSKFLVTLLLCAGLGAILLTGRARGDFPVKADIKFQFNVTTGQLSTQGNGGYKAPWYLYFSVDQPASERGPQDRPHFAPSGRQPGARPQSLKQRPPRRIRTATVNSPDGGVQPQLRRPRVSPLFMSLGVVAFRRAIAEKRRP